MKKLWPLGLLICPLIGADLFSTIVYSKVLYLQILITIGFLINFKEVLYVNKFLLALSSLLLWATLSSSWATDPLLSWTGQYWRGAGLILYFSILAFLFTHRVDEASKELLQKAFLFLASLIGLVTSVHFIFIKGSPSFLFTGNSNATALILGCAFLLLLRSRPFKSNPLNYALGAQLILAQFLTGSRIGLIGLVASVLIYTLLEKREYLKKILIAGSASLLTFCAYHFLIDSSFFSSLLLRTQKFYRLKIWSGAYESFLDKPFMGWGFHGLYDGFWSNYPGSLGAKFQWIDNAHSLPLNILSELGIIGFSLFIMALFFFYKELKEKKDKFFWISYSFFIGAYLLVQPVYIDSLVVLIISYFIFSNSDDQLSPPIKVTQGLKSLAFLGLGAITLLQINQNKALHDSKVALKSSKNYRPYWRDFYETKFKLIDPQGALIDLSSQFNSFITNETISASDKKIFSKLILNEFNKFEDLSSHRPRFLDLYGTWLMRNQMFQEANSQFDKILERAPNNSQILILKAESEVKRGFKNNSIDLFERAERIDPLNINTKMNLARLYMELGFKEKGISKLKEASNLDPSNKKIQSILKQF
ncbi:MAG: O-antigen ligase [Bacteriovoracaceae bacterium]|jgi:O-antigen ligase